MDLIEMFSEELEEEAVITKRFIEALPDDKYDWQPHPKSMTLERLVNHIAELPEWIAGILTTDGMDFEKEPYVINDKSDKQEIMNFFDECLGLARKALKESDEKILQKSWKLSAGDMVFSDGPKWKMLRHTLNQMTHHRAQLGVYFRLLEVPVPSSYGGSADDDRF